MSLEDENGQQVNHIEQTPVTLELLDGKIDEVKAMMLEILMWKTEIEQAAGEMQGGGLLSVFGKMFGASSK